MKSTLVALFALSVAGSAFAQSPFDEYAALSSGDPDVLRNCLGGTPDTYGMVGSNSHLSGGTSGSGPFSADEQRGAIDTMFTGLALQPQVASASSTLASVNEAQCDSYVAQGVAAIQGAYAIQNASGSFPATVSESSSGLTGSGDLGSDNMRFFLAYSNQALYLLTKNSHYMTTAVFAGQTGAQVLTALYPKIKLAMDYLYSPNGSSTAHTYTGSHSLQIDIPVPNRTLIVASAFAHGAALLTGSGYDANVANYRTEAQWWISNEFTGSSYFGNGRALFDTTTGAFREGGVSNHDSGYGYDSSYQAVACRFFFAYAALYPHDIAPDTATVMNYMQLASEWLGHRILTQDPRTGEPGTYIDDTLSTRTGPTGGWAEKKTADFDTTSARFALLLGDALQAQYNPMTTPSDGTQAARRLPSLVSNLTLPPGIVCPTSVILGLNQPMTQVPVIFTNTGVISSSSQYQSADSNFTTTVSSLPAGLTATSAYNTYTNVGTTETSGTINDSSKYILISGTPTSTGSTVVTIDAKNEATAYAYSGLPGNTSPPAVQSVEQQSAVQRSITFTVANTQTLSDSEDTFTQDGTANEKVSQAPNQYIEVKVGPSGTTGVDRNGYVGFDTSAFSGTVVKAVLQLYGSYGTDTAQTFNDIRCFGVTSTWAEGDPTWDSPPTLGNQVATATILQGSANNRYYTWDVTPWVIKQLAAGKTSVSFCLIAAGPTNAVTYFYGRHHTGSTPPQLVLYYQ